jgi:hypothetical protein
MGISAALGSSALLPAGLGFRNVLINGDMRINQRGSSYTAVGYTLDRWYMGVTGAYTVSQSTSTPPTGFQNFMRVQRTNGSSNTGVPQIAQSLETTTSIPLQGKQVTVSFYARAGANYSAASSILNWRIYGGTGTDQNVFSYTGQAIVVDQSVTLTTSWQRFTFTTTALTSYNEYALFFFSTPVGTAGAADYFDITGVQLEANYQPTPFEQRPIGVELQLCQRYYYAPSNAGGGGTDGAIIGGMGYNYSTTNALQPVTLPVPMRTQPTIAVQSTLEWALVNATAQSPSVGIFTSLSGNHYIALDLTGMSGMTAQMAGWLRFATATTGSFAVSAEL